MKLDRFLLNLLGGVNVFPYKHIHFIGIGGYGMSAIAKVLLELGYEVSGSDLVKKELTDKLVNKGANVFIGHKAENIQGADLVVYSSDVPPDNVELIAAKAKDIPIMHRAEILAELLNKKKGIAIAGAHGKTTTTAMISLLLVEGGIDPTYVVGGEMVNFDANAQAGLSDYLIAEADESDGSFLRYHPYISVVTNIEADHLENFNNDFNNLIKAYQHFLQQTKDDGVVVLCNDDQLLNKLKSGLPSKVITYGFEEGADYLASNLVFNEMGSTFSLFNKENYLGEIRLNVAGKHNVLNSLAAIIVGLTVGIPLSTIKESLAKFRGTKRRMQIIGDVANRLIIDDYAHHPTEIMATINACLPIKRRIIAVFQPHRYTRTHFLLTEFSQAFTEADEVIITNIYSPKGDQPIAGVSGEELVNLIRLNSNHNVKYLKDKDDVFKYLISHTKEGDLVLTMGAGDIWQVAVHLKEHWEKN